ncbi:MAG: 3-deoxy-7-phosphoheptulonate synthase, partial [Granulosicoccaceae bacterium]
MQRLPLSSNRRLWHNWQLSLTPSDHLTMTTPWQPDHWRQLPPVQMPQYADTQALQKTRARLSQSAPLVFAGEVDRLTASLGEVAQGRGFLLQGGDCAESFAHYHPDNLQRMFKVFLQMALVLTYGASCPVVKVGRIAGQFAKPRSSDTETRDGVTLPSYRGDIINDVGFDAASREPDPYRMLRAYSQSAATLNFLRGLAHGGFASLKAVSRWNADFLDGSDLAPRYQAMNHQIDEALKFMQACQVDLEGGGLSGVDLFTSHEALLLEYEEALTRIDSTSGKW